MEVDFDNIINQCNFQINLLKNKRLNEIKEEAREYSRKIECNEYKTQEELIDVKNKVIKLKQEYNDIMNKQNKKDDIKVVKIPINDNKKEKKCFTNFSNINNNERKKNFEKRKVKILKKINNENNINNTNNTNDTNNNNDNNDNYNDIKILSFNDFMDKLMYGNFEN